MINKDRIFEHALTFNRTKHVDNFDGDGQNTDPQSMDYPYGLPKWTTLNNGLSLKILLQ